LFQLINGSWKMVMHHASSMPSAQETEED